MKKWRRTLAAVLAVLLLLSSAAKAAENTGSAPDYGERESWAYFELGEDTNMMRKHAS